MAESDMKYMYSLGISERKICRKFGLSGPFERD